MKILITGGASNIGFETGVKLAKLKHEVYLAVHHDYEVPRVMEKITKLQLSNLKCLKMDIKKDEDCKQIRKLNPDCLINNAAIGMGGSMLDIPISKLKENFEVNVFRTLRLTQIYAAHTFLEQKKGKVIFMSSIAGLIPISFLGSYSATKASLIAIATTLRREVRLISNKFLVKLIEPGIYNTGFNDVMLDNKLDFQSTYFQDLENITLKQKKLFKLIGLNNLDSITDKIVEAVLDDSNKLIYRAPFSQVLLAKLYMLFFK